MSLRSNVLYLNLDRMLSNVRSFRSDVQPFACSATSSHDNLLGFSAETSDYSSLSRIESLQVNEILSKNQYVWAASPRKTECHICELAVGP